MTIYRKHKSLQSAFMAFMLLLAQHLYAADSFVAEIAIIKNDAIVISIDDYIQEYPLANKSFQYSFTTEYFSEDGHKTSYETLAGVGFVNQARITLSGGVVSRIEVIRLQPR